MPKTALKIITRVIGALLLIEILFDPISIVGNHLEKTKTQRELAKAQQSWNSKWSEDYKITVRGAEPLICFYDAIITVQKGQLVKVESRELFNENSEYKMVEKEKWNTYNGCDYTKFTIPQVLTFVSDELAQKNPLTQRPEIAFDSENGYVTHYEVNYHGYGLFTIRVISDCCSWYEFSDYEPLK
jgi:hypothetical protein